MNRPKTRYYRDFHERLKKAVHTLLVAELTAFLDYKKYDRIVFNSGNSRNRFCANAMALRSTISASNPFISDSKTTKSSTNTCSKTRMD